MSLRIKTSQTDKQATLEVHGFIGANSAAKFAETLITLTSNTNAETIIINCSYLESINSDGLKALANILEQNKKIKITMHNPKVEITELLNLCGFDNFITIIHSTQTDAY